MPCRCDYEPVYNNKTYQDEHIKACKAQSLIHKLALILEDNNISLPFEINKRVKETRTELLAHKREEHDTDIRKIENQISKKENAIKQIKGLGGEPKQALLDELVELKTEKAKLLQVSDASLLGNAEY